MKVQHRPNKLAGAILGFTLVFGIGFVSSSTAHAQDRYPNNQNRPDQNWDRYGNYGGSFELRQTALNAGYNEGVREANNERQNGRQSDYRNSNVYRRATQNYNSRLGDRELYRRYFREAFENGYNSNGNFGRDDRYRYPDRTNNGNQRRGRNWDGYGNFGGSFQLRQTALNAGFNEGFKQGRKERNQSNRFGFQNQSAYQKATKDYSSRLGDRETYRRYFRQAYENGFADGLVSD